MTIPLSTLRKFAELSNHHKNTHATLVVKGGAILAHGYNYGTIHSEVNALNKLWPSKRKGVTLINIMITRRKKTIGTSKPCVNCMRYLRENKIRKVIFSTSEGFQEEKL